MAKKVRIVRKVHFLEECPTVDRMMVDITPEEAAELLRLIDSMGTDGASPIYGPVYRKVFVDYSPIFFDSELGVEETEFLEELTRVNIYRDAIFWSCYERHTEGGLYESNEVTMETLMKIADGEPLDPAELDDTEGEGA